MFSELMMNTWIVATVVAVVGGIVGFFAVARGSAFVAHALPQAGFAGAAGASLLGINTLVGLFVFALLGAFGIATLARHGRHDVVTALGLVMMLALGALFLGFSSEYAPEVYSLIFGEVLGVARSEILPTIGLAVASIAVLATISRPLLLSSILPEIGEARGVSRYRVELMFLIVVALVTTMSVPVVGALLVFSLLIAPAAAARELTDRPHRAVVWSVAIACCTVWLSIAVSYATNWPIGFFVGAFGVLAYLAGRIISPRRRTHRPGPQPAIAPVGRA